LDGGCRAGGRAVGSEAELAAVRARLGSELASTVEAGTDLAGHCGGGVGVAR